MAKSNKNRAVRNTKVTWTNVVRPKDSGKTVEELRVESDAAAQQPSQGQQRRSVPRTSLYLAENVFQWRGGAKEDRYERDKHIHALATALKNQTTPFDRLTVWPVADRFYVLDGHHRLAAYDTVGWTKAIPVEVFEGTLDEAMLRAIAGNIRDKLRMTPRQKSEAAWRITKENIGKLNAEGVAETTGISRRQAFHMKRTWKELNGRSDFSEDQLEKLPGITWWQARDLKKGGDGIVAEDWDAETWIDEKATALAELMRKKNVEHALMENPEITAMALRRMNWNLPEMLIEEWAGDYRELIVELAKRFTEPEEEF
ncbi:ParB/RepB/Spo0J family partition protein [Bradyrhizobium sp. CW11]|uniref:ParB N-terminal domain-containing protein n=1 Tax=Bradyrhizobium sp. CW11 TaxID=2782684 RepID=UPI001FF9AD39|nr:ParB-like nuclease domain-containing protein [Bradyrhizobium sp. CW11]